MLKNNTFYQGTIFGPLPRQLAIPTKLQDFSHFYGIFWYFAWNPIKSRKIAISHNRANYRGHFWKCYTGYKTVAETVKVVLYNIDVTAICSVDIWPRFRSVLDLNSKILDASLLSGSKFFQFHAVFGEMPSWFIFAAVWRPWCSSCFPGEGIREKRCGAGNARRQRWRLRQVLDRHEERRRQSVSFLLRHLIYCLIFMGKKTCIKGNLYWSALQTF